MPGTTLRQVNFAPSPIFSRVARDDERSVMEHFSAHAAHCRYCADPYRVHMSGGTLCDRGHAYARDVGEYIYSKSGKPYSVTDRRALDERVQVEIPGGCDVIRGLLKAIDRGLKVQRERAVVSHDRTYYVPDRRSTYHDDRYEVVEIESSSRRHRGETVYVQGRGSLYRRDEEERRRRRRQEEDAVIIVAAPRREHRR